MEGGKRFGVSGNDLDLAGLEASSAEGPEAGLRILIKIGVFVRMPLFDLRFPSLPLVRFYQRGGPLESGAFYRCFSVHCPFFPKISGSFTL